MLDYEEIGILDRNALYLGVPTITLMENAGAGVAEAVQKRVNASDKPVILFCGLGNNGGDGFVAARHLFNKNCGVIRLVLLGKPQHIKSTIAIENYNRLPKNIEVITLENQNDKILNNLDIANAAVIIDAMLGVGITGTLKKPYSSVVNRINSLTRSKDTNKKQKSKKKAKSLEDIPPLIIAVDVPTGLGTDAAIKPDITVTFHDSKTGMNAGNSGEIIIHDIGIPPEAEQYVGPGELKLIPRRDMDSHKGDHGRLLVIAGGPYTGAPALVGLSAFRTGVDLVHIATPHSISNIIASFSPNFIMHPLLQSSDFLTEFDVDVIINLIDELAIDAIVIGPGLGRADPTLDAIISIIKEIPKNTPCVLDADAFSALSNADVPKLLKGHYGVLTPHIGELKKLLSVDLKALKTKTKQIQKSKSQQSKPDYNINDDKLSNTVKQFIGTLDNKWTLLLKGNIDIITDGKQIKLNRTGNPGMTVGGTGDVLAGITGALLARGLTPFSAARAAAFINGYTGDLAWKKFGYGLTATDIIELIPQCFKDNIDE
jgi:NAD(P)H-hydrate epimerase